MPLDAFCLDRCIPRLTSDFMMQALAAPRDGNGSVLGFRIYTRNHTRERAVQI
jgi:hypothetical protein